MARKSNKKSSNKPKKTKRSSISTRRRLRKKYEEARKKYKAGQGGRFKAIADIAKASGATNPEAVAASIGIKKYGVKKMTKWARKAKKKKSAKKSKRKS